LNYQKHLFSHPTYRYSRILPQNGSMAPVLAANATTTVSFDLPAQCLNLGQSKVNINMGFAPAVQNTHFQQRITNSVRWYCELCRICCKLPGLCHISYCTNTPTYRNSKVPHPASWKSFEQWSLCAMLPIRGDTVLISRR
jgi:hypothetical protein